MALTLRPENRTGIYLAATGYVWFFGALQEADSDWLFTIGFLLGNLVWVPFTALVLAYPTGQFESRLQRVFPIVTGVVLTVPAVLAALFDSRPATDCPECADSVIALRGDTDVGHVLDRVNSVAGLVLIAIVITMLVRRWRGASPAMRKLAWPVIAAGIAALLAIGLLVISNEISTSASDRLEPLFLVAFAAVPVSFLFGVLRTRLARSSVSELVVALDGGEPLRGALAGALGDPELDVVYWLDWRRGLGGAGWVDLQGRSVPEPTADERRAVKLVERDGVRVAAIVYDRGLDAESEHSRGGHRRGRARAPERPAAGGAACRGRLHHDRHQHGAEPPRHHRDRRACPKPQRRCARGSGIRRDRAVRGASTSGTSSSSPASATG